MATLHLMCGLPCSGKTTLAKSSPYFRHLLPKRQKGVHLTLHSL
jgi:tRNA uridine 5-carbamoylmethylation protein Kti12